MGTLRSERPGRPRSTGARGHVPQTTCGVGWTAVSLSATLLVCAAFRLDPCSEMSVCGHFWWGHRSARVPAVLQHRSSEGRILAASRPAKTSRTSSAFAPRRVSFGRITEHLEVPNLLAIQTESFDWLVGNEAWQGRSADDPHARSGLAEILDEISPIEDFSGTMSLSFSAPRFDEVKASIEECKEKDLTYCAPLFVTAEFTNNTTGEIKSQTVFMGDFPMMTPKGTFIINGTERVVVSQLVRSPGVYFDQAAGQDLRPRPLQRQGHPEPGCLAGVRHRQARHGRCPHRPQAPAGRHRPAQGHRLVGRADPRAVRLVRADDDHAREGPHRRRRTRRCSTSTASCALASRRRARTPRPCSTTSSSTRSGTTSPRSVATSSTRSSRSTSRSPRAR